MPYRAKETIHSDVNPLADDFNGKLLSEDEGAYLVIGKGGILSDADAEKYGLANSKLVEKLEEGQAEREQDEKNLATVGAQFRAQSGVDSAGTQTVVPVDSPALVGAPTEPTDELKAERKAEAERAAESDAGKAKNVLTTRGTVKAKTSKTASKSRK